ncbi:PREDICTED: TRAF-type zinc finger domain-containing protein 1-like [Nicrophorus vespilloides]|uniref:TRAF-type zinc finger domain-containing protein 1-like n=1 Tax=Nicrophorus vespilloides TaxID=110193 RepID=A0ABM1MIS8_NICVS|nr:PREDICTED: TRAF-type zinc finger domain-containing protein 1-like [Nicrophorus vespilloides]
MAEAIEHELCANCKKEIPQTNYVMHMAHCARNIALCSLCKEPVPKSSLAEHKRTHHGGASGATTRKKDLDEEPPKQKVKARIVKETMFKQETISSNLGMQVKSKPKDLLACKYCELELPKLDLEEHENYCGTRTDKCNECGEFVMFKYKKIHEDSNHGFIKLNDEPGPRASWDSSTQRTSATTAEPLYQRRSRLPTLRPFDMTPLYNMADYIPPSTSGRYSSSSGAASKEKTETYKDLSRRLDCKTEYIRNLLHDSASITAPLRSSGVSPRNHFNHNKGPAPMPPSRRRNPPTELTIPCEFCGTPIPHEDLVQHETGCRPDLARRRKSPELDEFFVAPQHQQPSSPEVDLPCEFCCDMIPASQLLRHQATCETVGVGGDEERYIL